MKILIQGKLSNTFHWVGTYICEKCGCVFEVKVFDSHTIYQGNAAEDVSVPCPTCKNTVKLGQSYTLTTKLVSLVREKC